MSTPSPDELLYHYTTAPGLHGILTSSTLWATDAQFLNDSREMEFGRAELSRELMVECDRIRADADPLSREASRARVMESVVQILEADAESGVERGHETAFVSCFCEDGDLLSQWRGYAAGGGYALGFSREALARLPDLRLHHHIHNESERIAFGDGRPVPARLVRVQYGRPGIDHLLRVVRDELVPELGVGFPGVKGWTRTFTVVFPALASIKDPAFAEEREWRLVLITHPSAPEIQFRANQLGLVPFLPVPVPVDAIKEIVVGPGANQPARKRGVRRFLASLDLSNVDVRCSAAPFRG